MAVLGLMAELGPGGSAEHRAVGELAGELGIDVVAVDTPEYGTPPVPDVDAAVDAWPPRPADAVLVKASRVAGREALAARLVHDDG